jgi:DNA-binding NarL/FixJ family response regulator
MTTVLSFSQTVLDAVGTVPATEVSPLRIALPSESELTLFGVRKRLRPYGSRVCLLGPEATSDADEIDIALFDCFPDPEPGGLFTGRLPVHRLARRTVAYSWHTQPGLIEWALERGFAGYLSKALPISDLVSALEALTDTETPVGPGPHVHLDHEAPVPITGSGRIGLTPREAQVLTLVCSGLSNSEIALQMHISPNSLKSYIRSAYRRIGATSRSQAVLWGIRHGFGAPH